MGSPGAESDAEAEAVALDYVRTLRRFNRNARLVFLSAALTWFSTFGVYSVLFNLYVLR